MKSTYTSHRAGSSPVRRSFFTAGASFASTVVASPASQRNRNDPSTRSFLSSPMNVHRTRKRFGGGGDGFAAVAGFATARTAAGREAGRDFLDLAEGICG